MKRVQFLIGVGLLRAGSSMAVTLDDVKGLSVGTVYSGQPTGVYEEGL